MSKVDETTVAAPFRQLPGDQILLPIILGDGSAIYLKHTPRDKKKKIKQVKQFQVVDEILASRGSIRKVLLK